MNRSIKITNSSAAYQNSSSRKESKRGYSKGGCRECKRRKVKCDEVKPRCWRCERMEKECSYPQAGERVLRVSKKSMETIFQRDKPLCIKQYKGPTIRTKTSIMSRSPSESSSNSSPNLNSKLNSNTNSQSSEDTSNHHEEVPILFSQHIEKPVTRSPTMSTDGNHQSNSPIVSTEESQLNQVATDIFPSPAIVPNHSPSQSQSTPAFVNSNSIDPMSHPFSTTSSSSSTRNDLLYLDPSFNFFNQNDLQLLASDLNNIVSDIMFESNFDNDSSDVNGDADDNGMTSKVATLSHQDSETRVTKVSNKNDHIYPNSESKRNIDHIEKLVSEGNSKRREGDTCSTIPRNIPLSFIEVTKSQEKFYLEEFYNDFSNMIQPFGAYDPNIAGYFNPARDIIFKYASHDSFLLAAILAQGAITSFKKNGLPEDEEAYCQYLSRSLRLLGPALNSNKKNSLKSNIEAVLLTVLLLTSANASNTKQNWRPHLRGAKDLLLKNANNKDFSSSKILIFCKYWFISFEVLAGLSSKLGGTLKTDSEIDLLITTGTPYEISVMKELGIITPNGFNLLGGYHNECMVPLKDLIKALVRSRTLKTVSIDDSLGYINLLSQFNHQLEVEFVNKKCILEYNDFEGSVLPGGLLLDRVKLSDKTFILSWMDISHQSYVLASIITILTRFLNVKYSSPQVQVLNNKLISLVSFLKQNTTPDYGSLSTTQISKCSLIILQWPMLIAGMNCIDEDGRFLLMKVFRIAAQLGSGSAGFTLRKLRKIWLQHEISNDREPKERSNENSSDDEGNIDIVSY